MSGTSHPGLPFNPYKAWLGIDVTGRKPTHYELLGLEFGVVDAATAKASVLERSAKVRHYQAGKHADLAAQLLDELAEAQLVLTNAERKKKYDLAISSTKQQQKAAVGPRASISDEKTQERRNDDPERVVKVHSVQMRLESTTGYGLKSTEENENPAFMQTMETGIQPKPRGRRWHLYGFAFSVAAGISLIIATAAWMAIENTNLQKTAATKQKTEQIQSIPISNSPQSGESAYNSKQTPLQTLATSNLNQPIWLADLNPVSWKAKSPQNKLGGVDSKSFRLDPFEGMEPAIAIFENNNGRAFNSKVRLASDSASPVRFAIRAGGKLLWQSADLSKKDESEEVWIDISYCSHVELLTKCSGANSNAEAVWEKPCITKIKPSIEILNKYERFYLADEIIKYWYSDNEENTNQFVSNNDTRVHWLADQGPTNWSAISPFKTYPNKPTYKFKSFMMHPPTSPDIAFGLFKTHGNNIFSTKVVLAHDVDHPIRFGITKKDKLVWQSRDFRFANENDECCIDVSDANEITLMSKSHGTSKFGWAVWYRSFFSKNSDKTESPQNLIDYGANDYRFWKLDSIIPVRPIWLSELNPVSWKSPYPKESMEGTNNRSFKLHPFEAPKHAMATFENNGSLAFSSKVRLDADPGSPIRFAVRVDDKILWQSRDLAKKGDADECWIDVRGRKQINLLTRARDSHMSAWATWQDPHFINSNDYDEKIKAYQKPIDDPAVTNYWNDIGNPPFGTTPMPPVATSRVRFVEPLQLMTKEVIQRNSKIPVNTAVSIYKHHPEKRIMQGNKIGLDQLTQNGWGVDKTIGYLLSERAFGGPHDIKDKDMIFLTSRVDSKTSNTQYLLSNVFNFQGDKIVILLGWVFTKRIPGTIPVAIRQRQGIGNAPTHSLLVGEDAINANKNTQVLGTFFIYEKDPNIKQDDTGTGSPSVPNQNNSSASPSNKKSGSQTSDNSHHQFDAKALAAIGNPIFSFCKVQNGMVCYLTDGNPVYQNNSSWINIGLIGKASANAEEGNIQLRLKSGGAGTTEYFIGRPNSPSVKTMAFHGWVWLEHKPGLIECCLMKTNPCEYSLATDKQEIASRMKTGQWTIEKRFYILPPD